MKQCFVCYRFLSHEVSNCPYCGSDNIKKKSLPDGKNEELSSYRIRADGIFIKDQKYGIIDILGQGSHGAVLKISAPDGKYFALKVPLQFNEIFTNNQGNRQSVLEMSAKYVAHEVKMLNKIKNEALIDVGYAGQVRCRRAKKEDEFPAVLMELAYGTLKDLINSEMENRIIVPLEEKINIVNQLTLDLEKLHREGFVHRDLSPHNIFIVERDKEIRYVLADFGTSKPSIPGEQGDSTTRMAFHERYMDPALLTHDNIRYDFRIDIYQLGIIVTEILLGEYWMINDDETSTYSAGVDFEKDFLLNMAGREIPPAVLRVIRKATTRNIKKRYRSTGKFREEMQQALQQGYQTFRDDASQGLLKRNIRLSCRRVYPVEEEKPGGEKQTIVYRGQRKINLGTQDSLKIDFPDVDLKVVKIPEPSFLECQKKNNSIIIRVDTESIKNTLRPILKANSKLSLNSLLNSVFNRKKKKEHPRIEFDCKSILYIEGVRTGEV